MNQAVRDDMPLSGGIGRVGAPDAGLAAGGKMLEGQKDPRPPSPCLQSSPDTLRLTGVGSEDDKGGFAESFYASAAAVSRLYQEQNAKHLRGRQVPLPTVPQKRKRAGTKRKRTSSTFVKELQNESFSVDGNETLNFDTNQDDIQSSNSSLDLKSPEIGSSTKCKVPFLGLKSYTDGHVDHAAKGFSESSFAPVEQSFQEKIARKSLLEARSASPELIFDFSGSATSEEGCEINKSLVLQNQELSGKGPYGCDGKKSADESEDFVCSQELFPSQDTNVCSSGSSKSDATEWSYRPLSQTDTQGTGGSELSLDGKRSRKRKRRALQIGTKKSRQASRGALDTNSCNQVQKMVAHKRYFTGKSTVRKSEEAILLSSAFQYLNDAAKRNFRDKEDRSRSLHSSENLQDFEKTLVQSSLKLQGTSARECSPQPTTLHFQRVERDFTEQKNGKGAKKDTSRSREIQHGESLDVDESHDRHNHQMKCSPEIILITDTDDTEESAGHLPNDHQRDKSWNRPTAKLNRSVDGLGLKLRPSDDKPFAISANDKVSVTCDNTVSGRREDGDSRPELQRSKVSSLESKGDKQALLNDSNVELVDDGDETVFEPNCTVEYGNISDPALEDEYLERLSRTVIPETENFMGSDQSQEFPGSGNRETIVIGEESTERMDEAIAAPRNSSAGSQSPSQILKDLDSDKIVVQETEFFMEYDNSHPKECPSIDEDDQSPKCKRQKSTLMAKGEPSDFSTSCTLQDQSKIVAPAKAVFPKESPGTAPGSGSKGKNTRDEKPVGNDESVVDGKELYVRKSAAKKLEHVSSVQDKHSSRENSFSSPRRKNSACGHSNHSSAGSTPRIDTKDAKYHGIRSRRSGRKRLLPVEENEITVIPDTEAFMGEDSLLLAPLDITEEQPSFEDRERGCDTVMTGSGAKPCMEPAARVCRSFSEESSSTMMQAQEDRLPQDATSAGCHEVKTVLQPSQAFHIGREEAVLALLPGQVDCVLEQPFLVCLTPSSLSVWTQNTSAEWVSEVDWLIDLGSTAVAAVLVPSQTAVCVAVTTQEVSGLVRVWMFVYQWMSGNTDKIKVNIPLIICYRVLASSVVIGCGVGEGQLLVMTNGQGRVNGGKHCLSPCLSSLTLGPELEGREGRLLGLHAVQDFPSCVMGLSADQHLLIWDHTVGDCLQTIDLGRFSLTAEHLVSASSFEKKLLLVLVASGAGAANPGSLLLVNPLSGQAWPVLALQSSPTSWPGVQQTQESDGLVLMVDREGKAGLWSATSGHLLSLLPCSSVHSMAIHTDTGLAFIASELTGCVHTYSFQAA